MAGSFQMSRYPLLRHRRLFLALGMILFLLIPHFQLKCTAAKTLTINSEEQFQFAEAYFKRSAYTQAIDEYRRFLYFFPNNHRAQTARFRIGQAYKRSDDFQRAIETFKALINDSPGHELLIKSFWLISDSHVALGQSDAAVSNIEHLIALKNKDPDIKDEANYRIGWIYIDTGAFDKATLYFNRISPASRTKFSIENVFAEIEKEPLIERKNPFLAGTLSLVPGLGYLYCERPRDALVSFLVNGAMIAASIAAFKNDNPALGGILAFVELGFYSANIYGATSSAHKFNRRKRQNFIDNLKQNTRLQLSSIRRNKGFTVALQYRF